MATRNVNCMTNTAVVKKFEDDPRFTISFHLLLPKNKIDKQFNANRALVEEVSAFLERLTSNVNKVNKTKDSKLCVKFVDANQSVIAQSDQVRTVQDFLFKDGLQIIIEDSNGTQ